MVAAPLLHRRRRTRATSRRGAPHRRVLARLALAVGEERLRRAPERSELVSPGARRPAGHDRRRGLRVELSGQACARAGTPAGTARRAPTRPRPVGRRTRRSATASTAPLRSRARRSRPRTSRSARGRLAGGMPPSVVATTCVPKQMPSTARPDSCDRRTSSTSASTDGATWSQYTLQSEPRSSTRSSPPSSGQSPGSSVVAIVSTNPWLRRCSPTTPGSASSPLAITSARTTGMRYARMVTTTIEPAQIERARAAGAGIVKRTPVTSSAFLIGTSPAARSLLKAENLQRTGSFNIRGALQARDLGGRRRRASPPAAPATTPRRSPSPPAPGACRARSSCPPVHRSPARGVSRRRRHGHRGGAALAEAMLAAARRARRHGDGVLRDPYDDPAVIAGQGTLGLELARRRRRPGARSSCPSAGAGCRACSCIAIPRPKTIDPRVRVIGVQAEVSVALRRQHAPPPPARCRDTRRRHRGQVPGRHHPAAGRALARRPSSSSTRTRSPTRS